MPRPSSRLLQCLLALLALAVVACLSAELLKIFGWVCGVFAVVAIGDVFLLRLPKSAVEFSRKLPSRFAIGQKDRVKIALSNRTWRPLDLWVKDGLPDAAHAADMPYSCRVSPGMTFEASYPVEIHQRGQVEFAETYLLVRSFLGLWQNRRVYGEKQTVRVYPNYEPLISYALLATSQRIEQMGIVKKNRAGMSREFHQMRDYQMGDPLNRVDWKHTARRQQLISREYQEQRDQTVILAVDGGRRMKALDGGVPQFDHCLNAMLLLGYVALRQGDSVGVMKFGGEDRWLPPVKGAHQMPTLLNHLYDYETAYEPTDFLEASKRLLTRQKKRALVILLTNLRGEDSEDVLASLQQLRKKHLVVLANLREKSIDLLQHPDDVNSLDEAVAMGAATLYQEERKAVLSQLGAIGVTTLDEPAQSLPIALCNSYLDLKSDL